MARGKKKNRTVTMALFAAACVALAGSMIGTTRAALIYSADYNTMVFVSKIGVSLLENGNVVSNRDYTGTEWKGTVHGRLLENLLPPAQNGEKQVVQIGRVYDEVLTVKNSGEISQYVRVTLYKYWTRENGKAFESTELTPDLINLGLTTGKGWIVDREASSPEKVVLFYDKVLGPGEETTPMLESIQIDPAVANMVEETTQPDPDGKGTIYTTTFKYDGCRIALEAEVDAIQDHNAEDAIQSAWGRDVVINGTGLELATNEPAEPEYYPDEEEDPGYYPEEEPEDPGYYPDEGQDPGYYPDEGQDPGYYPDEGQDPGYYPDEGTDPGYYPEEDPNRRPNGDYVVVGGDNAGGAVTGGN